jgi:UrcA family protein
MLLKTLTIAAAAATLIAAIAPASAFDMDGQVRTQAVVNYSDLNTGQLAGAKVLMSRIKGAAKQVCGPEPGFDDLSGRQIYNVCVSQAVDQAVRSVGEPMLTQLHDGNASLPMLATN